MSFYENRLSYIFNVSWQEQPKFVSNLWRYDVWGKFEEIAENTYYVTYVNKL